MSSRSNYRAIFGRFISAISPAQRLKRHGHLGVHQLCYETYVISAALGQRLQRREVNYLAPVAIPTYSERAHLQKLEGDFRAIEQTQSCTDYMLHRFDYERQNLIGNNLVSVPG